MVKKLTFLKKIFNRLNFQEFSFLFTLVKLDDVKLNMK